MKHQIISANGIILRIDTQTGRTWRLVNDKGDFSWVPIREPIGIEVPTVTRPVLEMIT